MRKRVNTKQLDTDEEYKPRIIGVMGYAYCSVCDAKYSFIGSGDVDMQCPNRKRHNAIIKGRKGASGYSNKLRTP